MKIDWGPTKGDLIATDKGVYVLEITSRLSPAFSMFLPDVADVDPLSVTIKWATGITVDSQELKPKYSFGFAHRYYFHKPGTIIVVEGFSDLSNMPGVIKVVKLQDFQVGHVLTEASYINRLFYILVKGKNRHDAELKATHALSTVKIITE